MRKDGTLRFGDFVSAILHLSDAFGRSITQIILSSSIKIIIYVLLIAIFEGKDPLQNGSIKLNLSEVIKLNSFS